MGKLGSEKLKVTCLLSYKNEGKRVGPQLDFDFEFAEPELEEMVFMGSIPRYSDFSTAMMILEKIGGISFTVNDGKILVKRK